MTLVLKIICKSSLCFELINLGKVTSFKYNVIYFQIIYNFAMAKPPSQWSWWTWRSKVQVCGQPCHSEWGGVWSVGQAVTALVRTVEMVNRTEKSENEKHFPDLDCLVDFFLSPPALRQIPSLHLQIQANNPNSIYFNKSHPLTGSRKEVLAARVNRMWINTMCWKEGSEKAAPCISFNGNRHFRSL